MTEHQQHEATEGLPPQAILYDLIDGFTRTQCISVVSKLGVADELATGPKTAEELGQAVAAHLVSFDGYSGPPPASESSPRTMRDASI